ncbi:hypothetical protein CFC21_051512 [Triticum aestivum]|uniref:DUF295 domain-containing protein n=3 Tax=Triticum TaxID=4564 RepID=A0A9R0VV38_TRITD|nr:hypothetical protein CFC21_051512 [Triticum aestivum]VAH88725.1 unnamed protein product [Triticum turgidum subsp. durum]
MEEVLRGKRSWVTSRGWLLLWDPATLATILWNPRAAASDGSRGKCLGPSGAIVDIAVYRVDLAGKRFIRVGSIGDRAILAGGSSYAFAGWCPANEFGQLPNSVYWIHPYDGRMYVYEVGFNTEEEVPGSADDSRAGNQHEGGRDPRGRLLVAQVRQKPPVENALDSAVDATRLSCGALYLADFIGKWWNQGGGNNFSIKTVGESRHVGGGGRENYDKRMHCLSKEEVVVHARMRRRAQFSCRTFRNIIVLSIITEVGPLRVLVLLVDSSCCAGLCSAGPCLLVPRNGRGTACVSHDGATRAPALKRCREPSRRRSSGEAREEEDGKCSLQASQIWVLFVGSCRHKQGKTIASLLWAAAAPTLLDAMQVTFSRLAGGDEAHGKAGVHCALKKPTCRFIGYIRQNFSYRSSHVSHHPPHHVAEEASWSAVEAFWAWSMARSMALRFLEPREAMRETWGSKSRGLRSAPWGKAWGDLQGGAEAWSCGQKRSGAAGRSRGLEPAARSGGDDERKE